MVNPEELAEYILQLPVTEARLKRWQLLQEAELMRRFVVPDLVEPGHMNPGRWQNIATTYKLTGLAKIPEDIGWLDTFVFDVAEESEPLNYKMIGLSLCFIGLIALLIAVWNMILHRL